MSNNNDTAICPKCNGSTRVPANGQWAKVMATYRESDHTWACDNCGGQTMGLHATGRVFVDPATGLGCLHNYRGEKVGNCYHVYTCTKCGDRYDIDSGD